MEEETLEHRKTLRDYLLERRVINIYFASNADPSNSGKPLGGYKIINIYSSELYPRIARLIVVPIGRVNDDFPLPLQIGEHLDDPELFPDELEIILQNYKKD